MDKLGEYLERARHERAMHERNGATGIVEAIDRIFPNLFDDKDERIRKELIEHIKDQQSSFISAPDCRDRYEEEENDKYNSWIAWLEKQGEQENENRWHKVEDSLPDNAREVLCKDAIGNFFIGRYYNDGDYWEVSMYDEPDKSNKDNPPVIMWANIPSCEQNLANSAKTCKDEQDPAWSEEDERIFNSLIEYIDSGKIYATSKVNMITWIKSLEKRYTWKPTEQQLYDMEYIMTHYPNIRGMVESIYNELKKL